MAADSVVVKSSLRKVAGWAAALVTMLLVTWLFWPRPATLPYSLASVQLGDVGDAHDVLKVPVAALAYQPFDAHAQPAGVSTSTTAGQRSQTTPGSTHNTSLLLSLNLTPDQRRKIEPVLDKARAAAESRYGATTGDQRRKILRDAMAAAFAQVRPLLTPDQQTRLDLALVQIGSAGTGAGRGVVYVLHDNKPAAIPVRVGASDGVFTVVQSYDLKQGDKVVVAGGPSLH